MLSTSWFGPLHRHSTSGLTSWDASEGEASALILVVVYSKAAETAALFLSFVSTRFGRCWERVATDEHSRTSSREGASAASQTGQVAKIRSSNVFTGCIWHFGVARIHSKAPELGCRLHDWDA